MTTGLATTKDGDQRYVIESVTKTLQVLFTFREPPYRFNIAEIETLTQLSKNQVFRSLKSLEDFGLLCLESDGCYRVTPLIFQLMPAANLDTHFDEVAKPVVQQVQEITNETVNLCQLVDGESIIIGRRESNHGLRLTSQIGQRSPLHVGACPKAMLAFLPKEDQERVIGMLPYLQKFTDYSVTEPNALRKELEEIRTRGYSITDEDFELGARGVGAPVFNRDGKVVGGVSVGGPISRVGRDRLEDFGEIIKLAAKKISRLLGYMDDTHIKR